MNSPSPSIRSIISSASKCETIVKKFEELKLDDGFMGGCNPKKRILQQFLNLRLAFFGFFVFSFFCFFFRFFRFFPFWPTFSGLTGSGLVVFCWL